MTATDQEEKNQRKILIEKLNLNELEVVEYLSQKMMDRDAT
jgi:hypothetical protein